VEPPRGQRRVEPDRAGLPRPAIIGLCLIRVYLCSSAANHGFVVPMPTLPGKEEELAADKRR
jgi:hypothetical protein